MITKKYFLLNANQWNFVSRFPELEDVTLATKQSIQIHMLEQPGMGGGQGGTPEQEREELGSMGITSLALADRPQAVICPSVLLCVLKQG